MAKNMTEIEKMMKDLNCKADYISSHFIVSRIEKVEFQKIELCGTTFMYCGIKMDNGFTVVGKPSACMNPENWRDAIGEKVSFENSFEEIYRLEAYRSMSERHAK